MRESESYPVLRENNPLYTYLYQLKTIDLGWKTLRTRRPSGAIHASDSVAAGTTVSKKQVGKKGGGKPSHFSSRRKLTGCWLIIMPMVPRGLFCVHRRRPYMYSTVCQRDRFNRALFFCPPAHLRVIQDHALVRACAHTHVRAHTHAPTEHHMNMVPTPSDEESGEEKKTLVDSYL